MAQLGWNGLACNMSTEWTLYIDISLSVIQDKSWSFELILNVTLETEGHIYIVYIWNIYTYIWE